MLGSLLGGRVGVLFAKPQIDRKLVISCLYHLLLREGSFSPLALRTLSAFPRETLCALTLKEFFERIFEFQTRKKRPEAAPTSANVCKKNSIFGCTRLNLLQFPI